MSSLTCLVLLIFGVDSDNVACTTGQNCTTIFQAAFDSGGTIYIPEGTYEVGPLFMSKSDSHVTFAPGSILQAQRGSFHDSDACLLTIAVGNNITVVGYGSRWTMRKEDYVNTTEG